MTPFLRHAPRPEADLRLFCFAHAGGGGAQFARWRREAPGWLDLCPVQLPARENRFREPAKTNLLTLADELAGEFAPFLQQPFALIGYSLGGVLAFEFARSVRQRGLAAPERLIVAASRAPQCVRPHSAMRQLGDEAFLAEIARRYGGLSPAVLQNQELLKLCLPSMRGDITMMETYQYAEQPPLACPISAFAGSEDEVTLPSEVQPWSVQTTAELTYRLLPGGHFFFQEHGGAFQQSVLLDLQAGRET